MTDEEAKRFDERHPEVIEVLMAAFEASGGCGHDLGLIGALSIVEAWELLRTQDSSLIAEIWGSHVS